MEDTAAVTYINFLAERIKRDWHKIHEGLKDLSGEKHLVRNERQAIDAFFRASIAIGMQAIKNIFVAKQAESLNRWIMHLLDDENRTEVMKYNEIYEKAVENIEEPIGTVAGVLLINWMGKGYEKFDRLGVRGQLLCMGIGEELLVNGQYWKTVKEKYKLKASELPNGEE